MVVLSSQILDICGNTILNYIKRDLVKDDSNILAWPVIWTDLSFYQVRKSAEEVGLWRGVPEVVFCFYMINLKCLFEIKLELLVQQSRPQEGGGSRLEKWSWDCQGTDGIQILRWDKILSEVKPHGEQKKGMKVQLLELISMREIRV